MNKLVRESAETLVITGAVIALTHKHSWPVRILTAVLVNDAIAFAMHPGLTIQRYKMLFTSFKDVKPNIFVDKLAKLDTDEFWADLEVTEEQKERLRNWDGDLTKLAGWAEL